MAFTLNTYKYEDIKGGRPTSIDLLLEMYCLTREISIVQLRERCQILEMVYTAKPVKDRWKYTDKVEDTLDPGLGSDVENDEELAGAAIATLPPQSQPQTKDPRKRPTSENEMEFDGEGKEDPFRQKQKSTSSAELFDGHASGEAVSKSQNVPAPRALTEFMGISKPWQRGNWSETLLSAAQTERERGFHIPVYFPDLAESMDGQSASPRCSWLEHTTAHWLNGKEYRSYSDDDERFYGISAIGFAPDGSAPVWVTTPPYPIVASVGDEIHVASSARSGSHGYIKFMTPVLKKKRHVMKNIPVHIAVGELWGGIKITATRFSRSLIWDHKYGEEDWRCSRLRACVSKQNNNNVEKKRKRTGSPARNRNEYEESCLHSSDGSGYAVEMQEELERLYV